MSYDYSHLISVPVPWGSIKAFGLGTGTRHLTSSSQHVWFHYSPRSVCGSWDLPPRDHGLTHAFSLLRFGWVIAAAATSAWLGLWQSARVAIARRAAGIKYPQGGLFLFSYGVLLELTRRPLSPAYAELAEVEKSEAAHRFNCAQRMFPLRSRNCPEADASFHRCPRQYPREHSICPHDVSLLLLMARFALPDTFRICRAMIWGLKQPVYSAAALELWVFAKAWYTHGYIGYGPKGVRTPHHQSRILAHLFLQRLAAGRVTAVAQLGKSFCLPYSRLIQMC